MKAQKLNFILFFLLFSACGGSNGSENSSQCVVTNCHGAEVTCGFGEPIFCTEIYTLGDQCRAYASCELMSGECVSQKAPKYEECVSCIKTCETLPSTEAFTCDEKCRESLSKL
jgi:hypothetical protein